MCIQRDVVTAREGIQLGEKGEHVRVLRRYPEVKSAFELSKEGGDGGERKVLMLPLEIYEELMS